MTDPTEAAVQAFMSNNRPFADALVKLAMIPLEVKFAAAQRELAEFRAIGSATVAFVPSGSSPRAVSPLRASIAYRKENRHA